MMSSIISSHSLSRGNAVDFSDDVSNHHETTTIPPPATTANGRPNLSQQQQQRNRDPQSPPQPDHYHWNLPPPPPPSTTNDKIQGRYYYGNDSDYDDEPPPLNVDFRCACFKLSNISTVDFTVLVKFVIVFEWNDSRLVDKEDVMTTNDLPSDLWGPDIILENAQNDCEVIYDSFSLLDKRTGRLKRTVTFHGFVYNPMDLNDFPFDSDELEMKFISISNWRTLDGTRFGNDPCRRTYRLTPMLRRKDVKFLIMGWGGKVNEFQIMGWSQKVTCPDDPAVPICFKFEFHLVRKAQFYLIKVMLPLWLLVVTSLAAFGIETYDLSGRLEVLVTLLLSTIAFLYVVQESVPKINHLTVVDQVVVATLGALLLSVLFSFVISIAPESEASKLNVILAAGYQGLYLVVNILVIIPPYRRYNKLKREFIEQQEARGLTQSGRFKEMNNKNKKASLNKSYSMEAETAMALKGGPPMS
eukprot:CAMPEP_0113465154 /NCGR_PEP_ID=MMETSP0014_2-20120614/13587_1 /TAXON_ID=2857 /ORGANISM="Nitzschia sp." /LENGTH=470 /DNA_ID=CAMNT_0000357291 /DNA_START=194 /DNA_END=1606 /DNA_ORIENTATION=- /assembly_acc=CAM_ASM_000159